MQDIKAAVLQYTAFIVFGAYTGQRTMATMSRLTVGQFRAAFNKNKDFTCVLEQIRSVVASHPCYVGDYVQNHDKSNKTVFRYAFHYPADRERFS